MPIEPGQTLLHYRLIDKIGEGGMGVVWRAQDTTLQREVAIKILPESVAADAERLARFGREARLLATLNHPNVAAVYGMHEADGIPFLAMELVRGEDLSERVARGPLPVDEALEIARAVAEALRAAHGGDVIHRDLKPANIRIGLEGEVKVLDFGLAKAMSADGEGSASGAMSLSPTVTSLGTVAGVLLGTAAYMSPEQARGRVVDKRADIWAFGCVLYELLTGKLAFPGETITDTLAAVVRADPDWDALPTNVPRGVRRVLQLCLAKNPRERLHDIADAVLLLDELSDGEPTVSVEAATAGGSRNRERVAWSLAAIAALAAIGIAIVMGRQPESRSAVERTSRFRIQLEPERSLSLSDEPILAFSPDGTRIAFEAQDPESGRSILYVRALAQSEPWPLSGTEGASHPFFSPDGEQLGFFVDGSLKRIPVGGGVPVTLAAAPNPRGAVWMPDDTILYSPEYTSGLWSVGTAGGNPKIAIDLDAGRDERTYRWPVVLPDGDTVLFTVGTSDSPNNYDDAALVAVTMASGEHTPLLEGVNMARFLPPDKIVFTRSGSLYYAGFDTDKLEVIGDPIRIQEGVGGDPSSGAGYFDVSATGDLIYVAGAVTDANANLVLIDRQGTQALIPMSPRGFHHPRFSPDGSKLAFTVGRGALGIGGDVWVYSFADGGTRRVTFGGADLYPAWKADGSQIAFVRATDTSLVFKAADGSGEATTMLPTDEVLLPESWSTDGKWVAVTQTGGSTDVYLLNVETQELTLFAEDSSAPAISPDGRWLAYASPASGNASVYVRPLKGQGKWQVSSDYAGYPRWTPDGRRLVFIGIGGQRTLMEVDVAEGAPFRASMPRRVIEDLSRFSTSTAPLVNWDTDGERSVFVEVLRDDTALLNIEVVVGWVHELAARPER